MYGYDLMRHTPAVFRADDDGDGCADSETRTLGSGRDVNTGQWKLLGVGMCLSPQVTDGKFGSTEDGVDGSEHQDTSRRENEQAAQDEKASRVRRCMQPP